mgnify:CR=1 FL=1
MSQNIVCWTHTRPLTEINFVEDGTNDVILVSAAHDKIPKICNGNTGDWIGSFHGHKGAIWSAKVDQATRTLTCTGSGDFSAKLWCTQTGKELAVLKHRHVVKCVDFSNDTNKIATVCQDGLLRVFDTCNTTNEDIEPINHIQCYNASKKTELALYLSDSKQKEIDEAISKVKGQYAKNKKTAILITKDLLTGKGKWETLFTNSKKKDDLCDALLMTLRYLIK